MSNFLLLMLDIWLLGGMALLLHYWTPRLGFAPLLLFSGALTVFVQLRWSIYLNPTPDITLFLTSNGLVPVLLMIVLVLYVANGAVPARMTIYGILATTLLVLVWMWVARLHLSLPDGGTFTGLERDALIPPPKLRTTLASLGAFAADLFVIAVFYQGVKNNLPNLPESITVGLALMASLWTDAILFHLIADLGNPDFTTLLSSDILGKTLSALILWMPLAVYSAWIAPRLPNYVGGENRRALDLLSGSLDDLRQALARSRAALKMSEDARRQEEAYRQQIIDHITEGLWLAEPNTHYAFYVNSAYERIWGCNAKSIYADHSCFINSLHPEDRERVMAELPKQVEGSYEIEYRIIRPDGEVRWIRDQAFPVKNAQGEVYRIVGIAADITERKQNEKVQLDLRMERERVKMLHDFVSHTSHDLKSPLTAISLKAHRAATATDLEKRQVYLKDIETIVTQMGGMIDDLLLLARLENMRELEAQEVDIAQLINDCLDPLKALAERKNIELVMNTPSERVLMKAAPRDLSRAFANLIENAINYTPADGQVSVDYEIKDHAVVVRVNDTGIGIPEEAQPFIFNRFFRAENARVANGGGTGLGLSIVQKVIDQHGGTIALASSVGTGTTITLTLPRQSQV